MVLSLEKKIVPTCPCAMHLGHNISAVPNMANFVTKDCDLLLTSLKCPPITIPWRFSSYATFSYFRELSEKQRGGVFQEVGLPLCEAFVAAEEGNYAKAVDLLYPVRYKVVNIGGSHAQVGHRT